MMNQFLRITPAGEVTDIVDLPEGERPSDETDFVQNPTPFARGWPVGPTPYSKLYYLDGGVQWIDEAPLSEAKACAWAKAKAARDAAEAAPFEWDGSMFDANKENIAGAALAALIAQLQGAEVVRNWTLADNTTRALSGPQLIALGIALTERIDAVHQRGRELRELIDNAATPANAYSYTWEASNAD